MVHRTSVSLDSKTLEKINELIRKTGKSVSEIVREAINLYHATEFSPGFTENALKTYIDFLSEGEHVIVDLEHWCAIWEELNEKADDRFWELIVKSGIEHGIQYYNKGLRDVKSILDYMEPGNFFRYKEDSDGSYTLILSCPSEMKFIRVFLENILKAQNIDAEIRESIGKLRIVLK
ncbi:ribbon-helix-helix protein, CopG family [Geoglobus acetivorans]|uniref:Ribbon-helix-helix protein, CopG family n=1 Tax=Geoglobus acetivorans TaxID=565033 RepID=A0ABZ3H113_GEOAI|nr:CopG family transcriptional regulator [Geoglobus acetivorans]